MDGEFKLWPVQSQETLAIIDQNGKVEVDWPVVENAALRFVPGSNSKSDANSMWSYLLVKVRDEARDGH